MELLLAGLVAGAQIALLACAFQVAYLPTRVLFLGLAGVYSVVPYIYSWIAAVGSQAAALLGALAGGVTIALGMEVANHGPLAKRGASETAHLVSSLGMYIVVASLVVMVAGNTTKVFNAGSEVALDLNGTLLTGAQMTSLFWSVALMCALLLLLRGTGMGLRLRAYSSNPEMLSIYGQDTERLRLVAFGLSGLLAASASLLSANDVGFDPFGGLAALLLAIVASMIGGRSTFFGAIVGGLLVGVLRAAVSWNLDARWQDTATFGLFAIFLLVRPEGLVGNKTRLEAA